MVKRGSLLLSSKKLYMFANDKSIENLGQLYIELKRYIGLQKEYVRLELVEKLTLLFSGLVLTLILIILGMMALFYFSFTMAYILAPWVGGLTVSYAIITAFILLILACIYFLRKQLIVKPLVRFLTQLFTNDSKN